MDWQITSTIDLEVSLGERHRHLINAIFLITRDKNWSCPREPFRRVHLAFLRSLGGHLGDRRKQKPRKGR